MKKFILTLLILAALAIGGSFLALKTDLFYLKKIQVVGTNQIPKQEIVGASGLHKGHNILFIHLKEVRQNILGIHRVKACEIKKIYPDEVQIRIVERSPYFILSLEDGYEIVDEMGVSYEQSKEKKALPVLFIDAEVEEEKSDILVYASKTIQSPFWHDHVSAIYYGKDEVELDTTYGISVVFIGHNDIQYNLRFAQKILEDLSQKNITRGQIYFNHNSDPIFLPAEEEKE